MNKNELYKLLYSDLVMTMGCTDVAAVGFAASKASSYLKGELLSVDLKLSDLLYKNSLRVGIPGTFRSGVNKAIFIGYLLKNPTKVLSVFEDADTDVIDALPELEKRVKVNIFYEKKLNPLYIDITMHAEHSKVRVVLEYSYDNIQEIYIDDKIYYMNDQPKVFNTTDSYSINTDLKEIFEFVLSSESKFSNLLSSAETNYTTAMEGIKKELRTLPVITPDNVENCAPYVRKYILGACFLRMEGAAVPVTGVAGSGNLGITVLTSALILSKLLNVDERKLKQALAIAVLVSTYIKRKMTLLTTICGSSLAGGSGVAAATAFLLDGGLKEIKDAINNLIAINAGILCDGAKKSCAFKVAFSAENGVIAAKMAIDGESFEDENGINKPDVEKSIQNIASINNEALDDARNKILTLI